MSSTIEITGLEERIRQFGKMATTNPMMQRRINEAVKTVLIQVRSALQREARSGLGMKNDPRNAYKAVRMAVYRRIFGGQVNILQSRRAGAMRLFEPPRKGTSDPKGRGGNRVARQERTTTMMSYQGKDRGFILRFLNEGAGRMDPRSIHSMGGHDLVNAPKGGNRGSIAPRNWFGQRSQQEMERAAQQLDKLIDDIIQGIIF